MPRDATLDTFDELVLQASRKHPVVVDFWAPWCQPCLQLAPLLEELAAAADGKWELVKIDVQEEQQLGAQFGIQSIPALKAFVDGTVHSEMVGAMSRDQLLSWIGTFVAGEESEHLALGRKAADAGDDAAARQHFEDALEAKPGLAEAQVGLAEVLLKQGETEEANRLLAGQDGEDAARLRLQVAAAEAPSLDEARAAAESGDPAALHALGLRAAAEGEYRESLETLLALVKKDRSFGDDAGRKAMVEVFAIAEPKDPELVDELRRQLAMTLY
ncbi:MAG: tetratricopeptide repeat protein [Acidobacteriota bacterium]